MRAPATIPLASVLIACLCSACPAPEGLDPEPPTPGPEHSCAETWDLASLEDAVFVDSGAEPGGSGSLESPLESLGAALDTVRQDGRRVIALAEGNYEPEVARRQFTFSDYWQDAAFGDDDLQVIGCGVDATRVVAIWAIPKGAGETEEVLMAGLEVRGSVQGLSFRDLTVQGARRGIVVRGGAGSERPVQIERVRVEDSVRAGLVLSGLTTSVSLLDVHVDGVEADSAGELGYGLVVDGGGSVWDAVEGGVEVEGGSIRDAVRVGVFVDHGHLEARDLEVLDTRTYNGHYGRGLHLQGASTAELEGLEVRGNNDVGLFALMVAELSVTGSVFAETISGEAVPGFPDLGITGDGLVATQGGFGAEPSLWSLNLEDNEFVGNGRAGALVEDVSVVIGDDNLFEGNGIVSCGSSFPLGPGQDALLWQGSAEVAGPAVEVGGNTGFSALGFDSTPLEADGLDE